MLSTQRWIDLLRQQYAVVSDSEGGLELLLAMRKFVVFLDTDPHARRYVKELDHNWDIKYRRWLDNCQEMRDKLSELEQDIRVVGAEFGTAIENLAEIPDIDAYKRTKHILDKIEEANWYQSWADKTDNLDLDLLHIERPPQTQTGHMISHVLSITRVLIRLAEAVKAAQETAVELNLQAEKLWRQYVSAQWKVRNDWMSSGKHALEQLGIPRRIIDGEMFVEPVRYDFLKLHPFAQWAPLILMYAPPDLRSTIESSLVQIERSLESEGEQRDFQQVVSLIRLHARKIFTELLFMASSRLAHQHLVERYKVRCENYDWKHIAELIESYAEQVFEKAEETGKPPRYELEDLLTLHFARYLYDNGYAVHYTPRAGVHEPDLIGDLCNDLAPIVVEAKVVGQKDGTSQGEAWIKQGLRALLAYLQKYYSDYGVSDGYLVVFRVGDEKFPMYKFVPDEWEIDEFTIIPKVINIGRINKKANPVLIRKEDFI